MPKGTRVASYVAELRIDLATKFDIISIVDEYVFGHALQLRNNGTSSTGALSFAITGTDASKFALQTAATDSCAQSSTIPFSSKIRSYSGRAACQRR